VTTRRELVEAARGDRPLDLVIRGGEVVNVYTLERGRADVGVYGDRIAVVDWGAREGLAGRETVDAGGLVVLPGFVDTHLHVESTMVTPPAYARAVLPFGTTTIVIDPHEIANVTGTDGVDYMLRASEGLPLRTFVTVPSSVPAVEGIETAGARFGAAEIAEMLRWPRVIGVAELMDYPGVVRQREHMAAIVEAGLESGKLLEGHAPLLTGRELSAYLAAGVDSDHESRGWEEMVEKLRLGMWVYGRENTFRRGAADLARALRELPDAWNVALCTDDIDPDDLLRNGHLDRGMRVLVQEGVDPLLVVRLATLNGATRYGLRDLGAVAPGKLADLALVESLESFRTRHVLSGGRVVVRDGRLAVEIADPVAAPIGDSVRIKPLSTDDFVLRSAADGELTVGTIDMDPRRTTTLGQARLRFENGRLALPLPDDLILLSVVPRHGQPHRPSLVLLRGSGLRRGALATTVAHDSHNLIVGGKSPEEMLRAAMDVAAMGGGVALVEGEDVTARVPLPVAGLMSDGSVEDVAGQVARFNERGRALGFAFSSPVLALSSLALPVSPHVRLTDLGVVDVVSQRFLEVTPR
jgi:adenine deaminase